MFAFKLMRESKKIIERIGKKYKLCTACTHTRTNRYMHTRRMRFTADLTCLFDLAASA